MRYHIAITLIVLAALAPAKAQTLLGARWGYSISTLSIQNEQQGLLHGFGLMDYGLTVKYFDLKYLGLQAELNYTQRGYVKPLSGNELSSYKRVNTYLEVPILMQLRFASRVFFMHLQGGPYGALLVRSEHGSNTDSDDDFMLKPYTLNILYDNRVDFGLIGGVGIGFDTRVGTLQLETNFLYGHADLYKRPEQGDPTRSFSMALRVSATYLINLSRIVESRK